MGKTCLVCVGNCGKISREFGTANSVAKSRCCAIDGRSIVVYLIMSGLRWEDSPLELYLVRHMYMVLLTIFMCEGGKFIP